MGAVVLVAVLWTAGTASSSQPAHPSVVHGSVEASGSPTGPGPWHVEHPADGVYRVIVAAEGASLDVAPWDAVADVTVRPLGHGANEVRFSHDGVPVDTAFGFVTLAR
jgi:hypothetical protein